MQSLHDEAAPQSTKLNVTGVNSAVLLYLTVNVGVLDKEDESDAQTISVELLITPLIVRPSLSGMSQVDRVQSVVSRVCWTRELTTRRTQGEWE